MLTMQVRPWFSPRFGPPHHRRSSEKRVAGRHRSERPQHTGFLTRCKAAPFAAALPFLCTPATRHSARARAHEWPRGSPMGSPHACQDVGAAAEEARWKINPSVLYLPCGWVGVKARYRKSHHGCSRPAHGRVLRAELFHHREETNMVSRPCVLARALARSPPYPPAMTVRAGLWCIYSCSGRRGQA